MKRRHRALLAGLLGLALSGPTLVARTPAAAPTFSPGPGTFTAPARVTLRTATAGAAIYYTTDGSNPSRQTSPTYAGPLTFDRTTTLKAFAYKKGFSNSPVVTGVYTVSATPPPPNESGGTLLLATLTPQSNATSGGSGFASLILTQDQTAAVLRYSYSGLTGPITSQHIHASDGTILFDLDTNPPQADGSRVWRIVAVGTYSKDAIVAAIRGGNCYLNLHTAAYPAGEIKGFFRPSNGSQTFTPPPAPPTLPPGPANGDDAARFLQQATFGPRPGEVEALQQKGFARWLDEQVALPRTSHLATYDQVVALTGDPRTQGLIQESFIAQAVQGQDQLRQRVTFALSELFVVSERDSDVRNLAAGTASYLDLLEKNAFGNFRQLLEDVTLSPTMGIYLDMAGSSKSIPEDERNPNENYPREILQLFTIGLYQLHPDGSLHLDAQSQPIPTYDQEVVKALARAFTGWTLGGQDHRFSQRFFRPVRNVRIPMEPWVQYHDTAEKALLDGAVLPAGQSATSDLEGALDVVFHHPNVGPFVCRALIQRLVSSNPSPASVYRCAQTFANNGAGVRGDLNAVVRSILLDYEARAPQIATRPDAGHLREPFVRLVALLRAIDGRPRNGRWRFFAQLDRQGQSTGETPLRAPSVFNFFEPGYALPGEIAQAGLVSPEFQITTETTALGAANLNLTLITNAGRGAPLLVTLTPYQAPQVANDEALLDKVDLLFFARRHTAKLAGDGSDAFKRAEKEARMAKPPPFDLKANTLFFVECGLGPYKFASGKYGEELHFGLPPSPVYSAAIQVDGKKIQAAPYDDLFFQATTRGGRVMDHILGNKAVFKTATDVAGTAAIVGGAIAASQNNRTSQQVGLGLMAAGLITKIISASTTPAADTRAWTDLPRYLSFASLSLPPGPHTARIEFFDQAGRLLPNLTKLININISSDGKDKVVFVSDKSPTPQNV